MITSRLLLTASSAAAASFPFAAAATATARVRIVSVNDVYELTNLPRLQTFLAGLSPCRRPSAVVLAGDFLSPSTLSSIDGGRGMVSTLRAIGTTHVSLGNHEQDLSLATLRERLEELSAPARTPKGLAGNSSNSSRKNNSTENRKGTVVLNSNMRRNLPSQAMWMGSVTKPYSLIYSPCGRASVALIGLLSDEKGFFRDDTFKSVPIRDVLETYTELFDDLVVKQAAADRVDLVLPLTHQSIVRDRELGRHMLSLRSGPAVVIGGHEHDPYHDIVGREQLEQGQQPVHILKSGMDARNACVVDLVFEVPNLADERERGSAMSRTASGGVTPRLVRVEAELVNLLDYAPSPLAQNIVDGHMSVVRALEDEIVVDAAAVLARAPGDASPPLSSARSRYQQTTLGGILCQMIKEELEGCDAAVVNGATIKGDATYPRPALSYAELKGELPFPTKIVVVAMTRRELRDAVHWSRTVTEGGADDGGDGAAREVPRRGYLQVDHDLELHLRRRGPVHLLDGGHGCAVEDGDDGEEMLNVALPRNLLNGFCNITPLMAVGARLKRDGTFPGDDDFVPALDLIVRHACKHRWRHLVRDRADHFQRCDLNGDGVLDRGEVRAMMTGALGYEPAEFVVDDMISAIDLNDNGVIDREEFNVLLARIERETEQSWKR